MAVKNEGNSPKVVFAAMMCVSIAVHVLLAAPVIYILMLAARRYSFIVWHPSFMSVGIGFLIMEAVFSVSGEALLVWKISKLNRKRIHWILAMLGLIAMLIGFVNIYITTISRDHRHFAESHMQLGLAAVIMALLVAALGIMANNAACLRPYVRPILIRLIHAASGCFMVIIFLATLITGMYTNWWRGTVRGRSFTVTSFSIACCLILLKPLYGVYVKCRYLYLGGPRRRSSKSSPTKLLRK